MDRDETTIGGTRLSWRALGGGPPPLLTNGCAATADDWDPAVLGALASFLGA